MTTLHPPRHGERGAILILTSISMIFLMAFTAFAIDLGQRNQQLAGAQHAIDASVLAAAQYLSIHDGDYAGASMRVKEVIRQNLGIDIDAWNDCDDPNHLDVSAPNDTNCISFRRIAATANSQVKNDIRVRLPRYVMNTIFGSAVGTDTIDLAAAAASNGVNCGAGSDQQCTPGTTESATTTTTPSPSTTTLQQYCTSYGPLYFAIYDDIWANCVGLYPGGDIEGWKAEFCAGGNIDIVWAEGEVHTWVDPIWQYVWFWTEVCESRGDGAARETWVANACNRTVAYIFSDYWLWAECVTRRPSLQDWYAYNATTTTQPWATTQPTQSTTTVTPPTVPSSIDLSN